MVALHGVPLFVLGPPLYPQTTRQLRIFEARYKLMIERALLGGHFFGYLAAEVHTVEQLQGSLGTLAHIEAWQFLDDGSSQVSVRGGSRFTVQRHWTEPCEGCDTGPLYHVDLRLFNDSIAEAEAEQAVALAATCNRLYHSLTRKEVRAALQHGHANPDPNPDRLALGIGHWASGIGHWASGIGHWALGSASHLRSSKERTAPHAMRDSTMYSR